jgi:hypothetical protein
MSEEVQQATPQTGGQDELDMEMDRNFVSWMKTQRHSIILSSYKSGSVFCLGFTTIHVKDTNTFNEQLSFWTSAEIRCMGIATDNDGKTLWIASKNRLTRYDNHGT